MASNKSIREEFIKVCFNRSKDFSVSLNDNLIDHVNNIISSSKESQPITDSLNNPVFGSGKYNTAQNYTSYELENDTLNWPLWLALFNDSWVFKRAIEKPAQDMINSGFTIIGSEDYSKVYKQYKKFKKSLIDLLKWGALFGGSIAVIMLDNCEDSDYAKPINKEKLKSGIMKLYVTDRWYGVSVTTTNTVSSMKDIDFGKPEEYMITFGDGKSIRVHHSWILRYEHRTAPNLIKNGQLQGWGYAEGAHILTELKRDDELKNAITVLVQKSNIEVIKMAGMRGVFMGADKTNQEQLTKRLEMVNWGRNYNSLTFLDADDQYEMTGFSGLGGLSDILQQNMWMIAAALDMPNVLFGDLKNGFSADQDAMTRYAETIKNRCEDFYRPILQKFLKILFIKFDIKGECSFEFNSLIKNKENADKVTAISQLTGALQTLNNIGVISKFQIASGLRDYMDKDIISIQFTEEQLNKLKYEEEMEIIGVYKKYNKAAPAFDNEENDQRHSLIPNIPNHNSNEEFESDNNDNEQPLGEFNAESEIPAEPISGGNTEYEDEE